MGDRKRGREEEGVEIGRPSRGSAVQTQDVKKETNGAPQRTRTAVKSDDIVNVPSPQEQRGRERIRVDLPVEAPRPRSQPRTPTGGGTVKKDHSGDDLATEAGSNGKKPDLAVVASQLAEDAVFFDNFLTDLVDELSCETAIQVHKQLKNGTACFNCNTSFDELRPREGLDVFGQPMRPSSAENVSCVHCGRVLNASRFAPHLEKCMGLGRNSSRIASRKINFTTIQEASTAKDGSDNEQGRMDDADGGEDDNFEIEEDKDDGAWVAESKKKKTPPKDYQTALAKKAGSVQKFFKN